MYHQISPMNEYVRITNLLPYIQGTPVPDTDRVLHDIYNRRSTMGHVFPSSIDCRVLPIDYLLNITESRIEES